MHFGGARGSQDRPRYPQGRRCARPAPTPRQRPRQSGPSGKHPPHRGKFYIQVSPYFDPTYTRTGWIGQPPILDRLEVVTDNGDVDTLGQATP